MGWASATLLPIEPPPDLAENETIVVWGLQYWECGSSGWALLLGWLCGPATLIRTADNRDHHMTVTEHAQGQAETIRQPTPPEVLHEITDTQNEYLDSAGLPSNRPHGFRWFQVLPDGLTADDIAEAAYDAIDAAGLTNSRHISESVPHIRQALRHLYS
jgi:hypothetical protein